MKRPHGFTLIELMITVAVIGILAAIAVPKFGDMVRKSREADVKGQLGAIRSALTIYYGEVGFYPAGPAGSNQSLLRDALVSRYLSKIPPCSIFPHHVATESLQTTDNNDFVAADASCDGEWVYVSNDQDQHWGQVAVECFHNDLKGVSWTSY